jgi:hypothetical protein
MSYDPQRKYCPPLPPLTAARQRSLETNIATMLAAQTQDILNAVDRRLVQARLIGSDKDDGAAKLMDAQALEKKWAADWQNRRRENKIGLCECGCGKRQRPYKRRTL